MQSADISKHKLETALGDVQRVSEGMSAIIRQINNVSKQTENIDSILVVIEEIAEQTNILSVNASIEAARGWSCR